MPGVAEMSLSISLMLGMVAIIRTADLISFHQVVVL